MNIKQTIPVPSTAIRHKETFCSLWTIIVDEKSAGACDVMKHIMHVGKALFVIVIVTRNKIPGTFTFLSGNSNHVVQSTVFS